MIKRVSKGESQLYKTLRLKALKDSPSAFGATYEDAVLRSDQSWQDQSDAAAEGSDKAIFLINEPSISGMAAIYREEEGSSIGQLFQMWVSPEARGSNTAKDILQYALSWAEEHRYSKILAEVTKGNTRALKFYKKFGFVDSHHSSDSDTHALEIALV
ncbi:GNAT family N-acetyltransferase [Rubritalea spongiae]|uniref:GNAT family N-acetyltransferase n=1 Tax=Rubritalea spongiae TaxID=430797 RepID=A0ABW5E6P4_9BACT